MDQLQMNLEQDSQELQALFEELLESENVYYNSPASVKMRYDAIRFSRSKIESRSANNRPYICSRRYEVIAITEDPDAPIIGKLFALPRCAHDRHYVADNLHHNVFTLYH